MTCEEALPLLSAHLDGENTPEDEAALQAHLAQCAACREILEAYEAIDRGVAQPEADPPEALHAGVMAQIRKRPQTRRRRWLGIAAAAAVLALVIAAGRLPSFDRSRADASEPAARALTDAQAPEEPSLTVELVDDPAAPAAENIAGLQDLTACVQGDETEYWTDAQTARAVLNDCAEAYTVRASADLAEAADDTPCTIRIVAP